MNHNIRSYSAALITGILSLCFAAEKTALADDQKIITSGACTNFNLNDIPVGDFRSPPQMPQSEMRITQIYNNTYSQGYCNAADGPQPGTNDPRCAGLQIWYGHDGIDLHPEGTVAGQNSILSSQNGIVVLSRKKNSDKGGWGETEIIAARTNQYSEEILTYQYSHLHETDTNDVYTTTRLYNACEQVARGAEIAKEGFSGSGVTHLHFTVRRWKNIAELKAAIGTNGAGLLGNGYSFGDDSKINGFLDPEGILYNKFRDISAPSNDMFYQYSFVMRKYGIEFGLFNGNFGTNENVKRREMARWVKIALHLPSYLGTQATFPDDVKAADPDFPYIEALARTVQSPKIIDPNHSCYAWSHHFCPENDVKRAEALKMVILAFYRDGFIDIHDNWIWRAEKAYAMAWLGKFKDVNPLEWYSEYVFYGSQIGIVADQEYFRPEDPISRSEIAKWIIDGNIVRFGASSCAKCDSLNCGPDQYCNKDNTACIGNPPCIPTESQTCEAGGGYDPCLNGQCTAGQKGVTDCTGGAKAEITCSAECKWQQTGQCSYNQCTPSQTLPCTKCGTATCQSSGQFGACSNQGICEPGQTETQTCNTTGTKARTCTTGCQWGGWGACSVPDPVCTASQTQGCGNCGTKTCSGGQWSTCQNEGTCIAGQTEQQTCNTTGIQTRTCQSTCGWGNWGACSVTNAVCQNGQTQTCGNCGTQTCTGGLWAACQNQGTCATGQTEQQSCNGSGTQTRTCQSSCGWGNWGACSSPNCICTSGPCCDGCNYYSSSYSCNQTYAYQCEGSAAGQNAQQAIVRQYCSGNSTSCDGQSQQFGWSTLEDCSTAQTCQMLNGTPKCVGSACTDKFLSDTSPPCFSNNGTVGTPTICLELKQVSGANWRYRACKQTGVFGNQGQDIKYRLMDANNMVQFAYFTEKAGNSCTAWQDFSVNYIAGYGAGNGAGIYSEILSPATCNQSSCTYRTGEITIRKECQ